MLIIVNPVAGGGRAAEKIELIKNFFEDKNFSYRLVETEYPGHATEIAMDNLHEDCIVSVGGDGTVREVAQALIGTEIDMGIIACGTGNDLCVSCGVPADVTQALEIIIQGRTKRIDTISVDGKLVMNCVGIGFDVDTVRNTQKFKKRFSGKTAYTLGIVNTIISAKKFKVKIVSADRVIESNSLITIITNSNRVGGGMKACPDALVDDGLLDCCNVGDFPLIKLPMLLPTFLTGEHVKLKYTQYFKAERVEVFTDFPVNAQIDGELVVLNSMDAVVNPASLKIRY